MNFYNDTRWYPVHVVIPGNIQSMLWYPVISIPCDDTRWYPVHVVIPSPRLKKSRLRRKHSHFATALVVTLQSQLNASSSGYQNKILYCHCHGLDRARRPSICFCLMFRSELHSVKSHFTLFVSQLRNKFTVGNLTLIFIFHVLITNKSLQDCMQACGIKPNKAFLDLFKYKNIQNFPFTSQNIGFS